MLCTLRQIAVDDMPEKIAALMNGQTYLPSPSYCGTLATTFVNLNYEKKMHNFINFSLFIFSPPPTKWRNELTWTIKLLQHYCTYEITIFNKSASGKMYALISNLSMANINIKPGEDGFYILCIYLIQWNSNVRTKHWNIPLLII